MSTQGSREQGAGSREQGAGSREQGVCRVDKNNLIILAILDHKTFPTLLSIPYSLFPIPFWHIESFLPITIISCRDNYP
ncbi:MAG: hypothetical protein F6K26_18720 [Moorea sp. SIO2I5]|nr:hypothetical protein [Moorena sp. SIO2I5]